MRDKIQALDSKVNKVAQYNSHPSGIEAIVILRHLGFNLGNTFKYVFRREGKEPLRSLLSAQWYWNDHLDHCTPGTICSNPTVLAALVVIIQHEPNLAAKQFYVGFLAYLAGHSTQIAHNISESLVQLIAEQL
jgi:hypothetical protein